MATVNVAVCAADELEHCDASKDKKGKGEEMVEGIPRETPFPVNQELLGKQQSCAPEMAATDSLSSISTDSTAENANASSSAVAHGGREFADYPDPEASVEDNLRETEEEEEEVIMDDSSSIERAVYEEEGQTTEYGGRARWLEQQRHEQQRLEEMRIDGSSKSTNKQKDGSYFSYLFLEKIFRQSRNCQSCGARNAGKPFTENERSLELYVAEKGVCGRQRIICEACGAIEAVISTDTAAEIPTQPEYRIDGSMLRYYCRKITHFELLHDLMEMLHIAAMDGGRSRKQKHSDVAEFMLLNARKVCREWCKPENSDLRQRKFVRLKEETLLTRHNPIFTNDHSHEYRDMFHMMAGSFRKHREKVRLILELLKSTLFDCPSPSSFMLWVSIAMMHCENYLKFKSMYDARSFMQVDSTDYQALKDRYLTLNVSLGVKKIPVVFVLFEVPRFYNFVVFLKERFGKNRPTSFLTPEEKRSLEKFDRQARKYVMKRKMKSGKLVSAEPHLDMMTRQEEIDREMLYQSCREKEHAKQEEKRRQKLARKEARQRLRQDRATRGLGEEKEEDGKKREGKEGEVEEGTKKREQNENNMERKEITEEIVETREKSPPKVGKVVEVDDGWSATPLLGVSKESSEKDSDSGAVGRDSEREFPPIKRSVFGPERLLKQGTMEWGWGSGGDAAPFLVHPSRLDRNSELCENDDAWLDDDFQQRDSDHYPPVDPSRLAATHHYMISLFNDLLMEDIEPYSFDGAGDKILQMRRKKRKNWEQETVSTEAEEKRNDERRNETGENKEAREESREVKEEQKKEIEGSVCTNKCSVEVESYMEDRISSCSSSYVEVQGEITVSNTVREGDDTGSPLSKGTTDEEETRKEEAPKEDDRYEDGREKLEEEEKKDNVFEKNAESCLAANDSMPMTLLPDALPSAGPRLDGEGDTQPCPGPRLDEEGNTPPVLDTALAASDSDGLQDCVDDNVANVKPVLAKGLDCSNSATESTHTAPPSTPSTTPQPTYTLSTPTIPLPSDAIPNTTSTLNPPSCLHDKDTCAPTNTSTQAPLDTVSHAADTHTHIVIEPSTEVMEAHTPTTLELNSTEQAQIHTPIEQGTERAKMHTSTVNELSAEVKILHEYSTKLVETHAPLPKEPTQTHTELSSNTGLVESDTHLHSISDTSTEVIGPHVHSPAQQNSSESGEAQGSTPQSTDVENTHLPSEQSTSLDAPDASSEQTEHAKQAEPQTPTDQHTEKSIDQSAEKAAQNGTEVAVAHTPSFSDTHTAKEETHSPTEQTTEQAAPQSSIEDTPQLTPPPLDLSTDAPQKQAPTVLSKKKQKQLARMLGRGGKKKSRKMLKEKEMVKPRPPPPPERKRRSSMEELEELLRTKKHHTLDMLSPAEKYLLTSSIRRRNDPFEMEMEKYRDKQEAKVRQEKEREMRTMKREEEAQARRKERMEKVSSSVKEKRKKESKRERNISGEEKVMKVVKSVEEKGKERERVKEDSEVVLPAESTNQLKIETVKLKLSEPSKQVTEQSTPSASSTDTHTAPPTGSTTSAELVENRLSLEAAPPTHSHPLSIFTHSTGETESNPTSIQEAPPTSTQEPTQTSKSDDVKSKASNLKGTIAKTSLNEKPSQEEALPLEEALPVTTYTLQEPRVVSRNDFTSMLAEQLRIDEETKKKCDRDKNETRKSKTVNTHVTTSTRGVRRTLKESLGKKARENRKQRDNEQLAKLEGNGREDVLVQGNQLKNLRVSDKRRGVEIEMIVAKEKSIDARVKVKLRQDDSVDVKVDEIVLKDEKEEVSETSLLSCENDRTTDKPHSSGEVEEAEGRQGGAAASDDPNKSTFPIPLTVDDCYITLAHKEEAMRREREKRGGKEETERESIGSFLYRVSTPHCEYRPQFEEIFAYATQVQKELEVQVKCSKIDIKHFSLTSPSTTCFLCYTCEVLVAERHAPCGKDPLSAPVPMFPNYPNSRILKHLFKDGPLSFAKRCAEAAQKSGKPFQFYYTIESRELIHYVCPNKQLERKLTENLEENEKKLLLKKEAGKVSDAKKEESARKSSERVEERVGEISMNVKEGKFATRLLDGGKEVVKRKPAEGKEEKVNLEREPGEGKEEKVVTRKALSKRERERQRKMRQKAEKALRDGVVTNSNQPVGVSDVAQKTIGAGEGVIVRGGGEGVGGEVSSKCEEDSPGVTEVVKEASVATDTKHSEKQPISDKPSPADVSKSMSVAQETDATSTPQQTSKDQVSSNQCKSNSSAESVKSKSRRTARDKFRVCENCSKDIEYRIQLCSGCKKVAYCNSHCQRTHWRTHKKLCAYALKKDGKA